MSARCRRSRRSEALGGGLAPRRRERGRSCRRSPRGGRSASPPRGRTRTSRASGPRGPDGDLAHQRQIGDRDPARPPPGSRADRGSGRRRCRAARRSRARGRSARAPSGAGRGRGCGRSRAPADRRGGRPRRARRRSAADGQDAGHLRGDRHDHRIEAEIDAGLTAPPPPRHRRVAGIAATSSRSNISPKCRAADRRDLRQRRRAAGEPLDRGHADRCRPQGMIPAK